MAKLLITILFPIALFSQSANPVIFDPPEVIIDDLSQTSKVCFADMDMDGVDDLLIGKAIPANSSWSIELYNHVTEYPYIELSDLPVVIGTMSVTELLAKDLNGDAFPDIIIRDNFEDIGVHWAASINGNGFDTPEQLFVADVDALSLGDVDDDGDIDIVFGREGEFSSPNGFIHLGLNTDGLGQYEVSPSILTFDLFLYDLGLADLNGDESLDLIVAPFSLWYPNVGGSNIFDNANGISYSNARRIATGDFDEDGDLDIISSALTTNGYQLRYSENIDGAGAFITNTLIGLNSSDEIIEIELSDLDDDGDLDIVCASQNSVLWFSNLGDGNISTGYSLIDTTNIWALNINDIDNDGYVDIIVGHNTRMEWFHNAERFVGINAVNIPQKKSLSISAFPNPFNSTIRLDIINLDSSLDRIKIFNAKGTQIYEMAPRNIVGSSFSYYWNGVTTIGEDVESGIYIVQATSDSNSICEKIILVR